VDPIHPIETYLIFELYDTVWGRTIPRYFQEPN